MFRAFIKNGKLAMSNTTAAQRFEEWKSLNEGAEIIIEKYKKIRSRSQNSYYWVYLGVIARETGDNADDLHEFFKRKFLPPIFKEVMGEEIEMPRTTIELTNSDFTDYLDRICALTNVMMPDPEKYKRWRDSAPLSGEEYVIR